MTKDTVTRRHGDLDVWQFDTSPYHRVVIPHLRAFRLAVEALGITGALDEPLARHTTFRIGGPADLYVAATEIVHLARLADLAALHGIPMTILGGGSNLLASDAGVRGVVIANQTRRFGFRISDFGFEISDLSFSYTQDKSEISNLQSASPNLQLVAQSGVALAGLARWAIKQGRTGLEWAVSVPGTVGGAVIGNAGAHGGAIADNLSWALVAYPGAGTRWLTNAELEFSYRSSLLKQQMAARQTAPIVLAAGFQLDPGDITEMTTRADSFLARRRASQPVEPSAGSIFRNPPGDHAGRLIEAVGLKGQRIGGAQIAPRHANFIVNVADAHAADVLALINLIRSQVFAQFNVELIPEILFVGDWPQQPPYAPLHVS